MSAPNLISPTTLSGGTPVGGSGTSSPSTIPRWTGPSTLGDSGLIDDGSAVYTTTRFIGIGRSTVIGTNCRLNVQLSGTTASGYTAPTNTAALFDCGTATNGGISLVGGAILGYYFTNSVGAYDGGVEYGSRKLYLRSQGTQALTVDGGNVGIGTASPGAKLEIASTSSGGAQFRLSNASGPTNWWEIGRDNATTGALIFASNTGERMRISPGTSQVAIGTTSFTSGCSLTVAQSIDASQSGQGLKLPATPGNADTQTLDCYQENTWTPTLSAAATWGGTQPTVTSARYTRIGRMVFCEVKLDLVAGFLVTYGSTTITGPFNAGVEAAVPVSYGATGQIGAQTSGSTTVYLPTVAAAQLARITWSFSI